MPDPDYPQYRGLKAISQSHRLRRFIFVCLIVAILIAVLLFWLAEIQG